MEPGIRQTLDDGAILDVVRAAGDTCGAPPPSYNHFSVFRSCSQLCLCFRFLSLSFPPLVATRWSLRSVRPYVSSTFLINLALVIASRSSRSASFSPRPCRPCQQQVRCPAAGLPAAHSAERRCLQRPRLLSCFLKSPLLSCHSCLTFPPVNLSHLLSSTVLVVRLVD